MGCGSSSSVVAPLPNLPVQQQGAILHNSGYGPNWDMQYFLLYTDSTIAWFSDQSQSQHLGAVRLKKVAPLLALGQNCLQVPNRPEIPSGRSINHMFAFPYEPKKGTKKKDIKVNWLLFRGDDEMKTWIDALGAVLPAPPQQNGQTAQPGMPQPGQPQPPPPGFNPQVVNGHPQQYPPPGQYPPGQYGHPPQGQYGHQPQGYPQQQSTNTTVVVQNTPQVVHHHNTDDGFTTGLLIGGAMGWGLGGGWGYGHYHHGWGWGSWSSWGGSWSSHGWGHGSGGWGHGSGGWGHGSGGWGHDHHGDWGHDHGDFGGGGCGGD